MRINKLLNFIVCPHCHLRKLTLERKEIVCHNCNSSYEVVDGVPVLIKDIYLSEQEKEQKRIYEKGYAYISAEKYQLENWNKSICKRVFSVEVKDRIKTYVDLGCGATAYTVIEAAKKGWTSFGIDLSIELVIKAKFIAKKQGVEENAGFLVASAENLPFKSNTFDYVSGIGLLEHLENDTKVIKSVNQILRKKGLFYILAPNSYRRTYPFFWPLEYYIDKTIGHKRHYSIEGLSQKMKQGGFALDKVFYNGHMVKFIEVLMEVLHLRLVSDKTWWEIDRKDINNNSSGLHLNAIFRKS